MTVDLSYRVDFAWVEPWSKAFYLYKHLVTWATVHCDRRGLKWQFWSRRLHLVWNWKNGQAWSVSTILLLLKVGRAYLGRTWGLLAQRGHEGHPTNCPELLEHGHNPGVAAPHCVLERRVAPPVLNVQVNLYIWFYIGYCLYIWFCIGYCLYLRFNVILDIAYIFYCTYIGYFANVRTNLAGLDEVFHAGRMVFHASKMESCPPVVVAHVHVHSCQVGSLKSHLVSLRKRL